MASADDPATAIEVDRGVAERGNESGTFWGRLRRERYGVRRLVEAWVPAVKVAGELVVEDAGADLQQ